MIKSSTVVEYNISTAEHNSYLQEDYKMSPYLQTMMTIESRQIITRLRLDMNSLHECMGRQ